MFLYRCFFKYLSLELPRVLSLSSSRGEAARTDAKPEEELNQLRKHTDFRTSFLIQLVTVNGYEPKLYTLRELIAEYINHGREVIK